MTNLTTTNRQIGNALRKTAPGTTVRTAGSNTLPTGGVTFTYLIRTDADADQIDAVIESLELRVTEIINRPTGATITVFTGTDFEWQAYLDATTAVDTDDHVDNDIITTYKTFPHQWVNLADLRAALHHPHHVVTAALIRLADNSRIHLAPWAAQSTLTESDHAAAVTYGTRPQHMMAMDQEEPLTPATTTDTATADLDTIDDDIHGTGAPHADYGYCDCPDCVDDDYDEDADPDMDYDMTDLIEESERCDNRVGADPFDDDHQCILDRGHDGPCTDTLTTAIADGIAAIGIAVRNARLVALLDYLTRQFHTVYGLRAPGDNRAIVDATLTTIHRMITMVGGMIDRHDYTETDEYLHNMVDRLTTHQTTAGQYHTPAARTFADALHQIMVEIEGHIITR